VGAGKRSLVIVLTDVLEESAARPLLAAVPVLIKHHAVVVASVTDPELTRILTEPPGDVQQAYETAAAVDVLTARQRVTERLRFTGATVVDAKPGQLAVGCVAAYLAAKSRARL
jgi:uncharacterized protein (DUF58 family)